jgi:phosphoglycerate kinase
MSSFKDFSFAGKKALIRVDFNVPLNDAFEITDDNRMRATIPTITKILKDGGSVILMSHLGRPKDGPTEKYSLKHIVAHLSKLLGVEVQFANDCIGAEAIDKAAALSVRWIVGRCRRHGGHCPAFAADGAVHDLGGILFRAQ